MYKYILQKNKIEILDSCSPVSTPGFGSEIGGLTPPKSFERTNVSSLLGRSPTIVSAKTKSKFMKEQPAALQTFANKRRSSVTVPDPAKFKAMGCARSADTRQLIRLKQLMQMCFPGVESSRKFQKNRKNLSTSRPDQCFF